MSIKKPGVVIFQLIAIGGKVYLNANISRCHALILLRSWHGKTFHGPFVAQAVYLRDHCAINGVFLAFHQVLGCQACPLMPERNGDRWRMVYAGIRHMVLSSEETSNSIQRLGMMGTKISSSNSALWGCYWDNYALSIIDWILTFSSSKRNSILISGFWEIDKAISTGMIKLSRLRVF